MRSERVGEPNRSDPSLRHPADVEPVDHNVRRTFEVDPILKHAALLADLARRRDVHTRAAVELDRSGRCAAVPEIEPDVITLKHRDLVTLLRNISRMLQR